MGNGPTNPAETYFDKGQWGYDGAQWRKSALLWGFSDVYEFKYDQVQGAGGSIGVQATAIPAGYVGVLTVVEARDVTTNPTAIYIFSHPSAEDVMLRWVAAPGANAALNWEGMAILKAGGYFVVYISGVVVGDRLVVAGAGYLMAVT